MLQEKLSAVVRALNPRAPLLVTFTGKNNSVGILRLLQMSRDGKISLDKRDEMFLCAVVASDDWGHDSNKKVTIYPRLVDADNFAELLHADIECVRSASDSPLHALLTGRVKKRDEAVQNIVAACITNRVSKEVGDWGLQVVWAYEETYGLPQINLFLMNGDEICRRLTLDATTGQSMVNWREPLFVSDFGVIEGQLLEELRWYLLEIEQETAKPMS